MVERGFFPSRARAQAAIRAGMVQVNGQAVIRPSAEVTVTAGIEAGDPIGYVGRGGQKLEGALDDFGVSPAGRVCLDIGASTGGFTQCLLRRGARLVYAVDVGRNQLHPDLRADPAVVVLEETDVRDLRPAMFPEPPSLATVDLSFISLEKVLPYLALILPPESETLVLVKPQFEAGRGAVGKRGVVRDSAVRNEAVNNVARAAAGSWRVLGRCPSRLTGGEGNQEFFLYLHRQGREKVDG